MVECIKIKDLRGVDRSACNNCGECDDFIGKVRCDYCDCATAKHVTLSTRKDMTHGVISIDSILLNSMRNGKNVNFRGRKMGITSPPP